MLKHRFVPQIIILSFFSLTVLHPQEKMSLAIIDFDGFGISEQEASVLTNRLGTYLVQSGVYRIIERGQMRQILEEQDFQMAGCTSDECAVEIGQLLGAELILAGSFGKIGSTYTIDMRIIDVTTGGILETASYDIRGEIDQVLTEGLSEAASLISGVGLSAPPPAPTPTVPVPAPPAMPTLEVRSQPAGAEVELDGQFMNVTPLSRLELEPNRQHSVALNLDGYYPLDTTLFAEVGQHYRLNLRLVQLKSWLRVQGDPGARISVNGKFLGSLPLDRVQLAVGSHEFKATKPEYFPYTTQVTVSREAEAQVSFSLQNKPRRPALLFSALVPGGGQLYLGYRNRGLLFLAAAAVSGYLTYNQFAAYMENKDSYESSHDAYYNAGTLEDIDSLRRTMETDHEAMISSARSLNIMAGVLGGVWLANLVEIYF
ncbi:MAG: PEGA domain-containing protein [Fidelibacterota bacterium]|nr:MAG: PEGA domain-containing protein [Candidatus Neomarinimicrobiota bacterium]